MNKSTSISKPKNKEKGVKAWALELEIKTGAMIDIEEIFSNKIKAEIMAKKLGFGHKVIPVLITPIKVGKNKEKNK